MRRAMRATCDPGAYRLDTLIIYVQSLGGFYYQPSHASNGWFLASE